MAQANQETMYSLVSAIALSVADSAPGHLDSGYMVNGRTKLRAELLGP